MESSSEWCSPVVTVRKKDGGEAGLKVKLKKCEFGRKYMAYLGHQVGSGKVAVPEMRVKAI